MTTGLGWGAARLVLGSRGRRHVAAAKSWLAGDGRFVTSIWSSEDYAFERPPRLAGTLRALELTGAERRDGGRDGARARQLRALSAR